MTSKERGRKVLEIPGTWKAIDVEVMSRGQMSDLCIGKNFCQKSLNNILNSMCRNIGNRRNTSHLHCM